MSGGGGSPNVNAPAMNGNVPPSNENAEANANTSANTNATANANAAGNQNDNGSGLIEPVFPANYRETYTEVRNCRSSIEHGPFTIRVLADPIGLAPYLNNENPLPVGSVIVKEEYGGLDCDDLADLVQWRVMRKEAPGFDPADGDWHWQIVRASDRTVTDDTKLTCIRCHSVEECLARDYQCTEP